MLRSSALFFGLVWLMQASDCNFGKSPSLSLLLVGRNLMRLLTRHSTLYTEMVVDSTILHNTEQLEEHLGDKPKASYFFFVAAAFDA